ncbi:TPA: 30S ribosomal protein S3 [Candidatus Poribacteria bacterium]|nr:30S ribosomal protein S3 [Candidatus Poribacteria bacterium]
MGQKTHPRGLRLGFIETWDSKWYGEKEYADWLHEDLKIQSYIKEQLFRAGISKVEIERFPDKCIVHIHTARPGIVIGRRGAEVEKLTADLERLIGRNVRIVIEEIKRPELDAQLVAEGIALQLERRAAHKVAMKKAVAAAMRMGAEGIKILCGGRLAGIEIARKEKELEGRVPLQTLRANIDYGFAEANTTYGKIGVKVWIFKGEIIGRPEIEAEKPTAEFPAMQTGRRIDLGRRPRRTDGVRMDSDGRDERTGERPARGRGIRRSSSRTGRRPTGGRPVPTRTGGDRRRRNSPQK